MINRINFDIISDIREKTNIVEVISSYIKLTRKGNNYVGLCPFHPDTTPSLVVSPKKQIFKCFVCNAKGNVFSFVQQYLKISFLEAVHTVAKLINYDDSKLRFAAIDSTFDPKIRRLIDLNNQANKWYQGFLFNPENQKQLDYLRDRKLDEAVIERFGFGYATNGNLIYKMATNHQQMFGATRDPSLVWNEQELLDAGLITINKSGEVNDFFKDRITVPIHDNNGYLVGFSGRTIKKGVEPKYLNTSTTQLFTKANVLYNFHQARILDPDRIILVEGFMDAIAYYRAGFKNAVATMGTALSEGHITSLHSLNNLKVVILSFDNDHAGIEATISNGQKLMEHGFKVYVVAKYDSNIKDVDELFRLQGQEAVNKILENRDDYFNFLINHIFSKKMPKDEIQIQAEKIIDSLVMFGDSSEILRMQILKSLAHKTNLEYEDLLNKLQHDLQKQLKTKDLKTQSRKPTKPTNNFGLNQNFIESVGEQEEIKQEVLTNYQKLVYGLKEEIALLNEKINRNYDEVISAVLTIPDSAKEISAELSYSVDFQYTGQRFIIKSILGLLRENKPVTQLTLLAFMEARKRNDEGYEKAIEYFLNFLNSEIHVSNKMLTKRNKKVMQGNHLAIQGHKYRRIIAENSLKMIELFRHKPFDENTRHTINEITLHNRAIEEDWRQLNLIKIGKKNKN